MTALARPSRDQFTEGLVAALDAYAPYWAEDYGPDEIRWWIETRWVDIQRQSLPLEIWAQRCLEDLEELAEALFV